MVYLELVEDGDAEVVYDYMPEDKAAPRGTVAIDKATRKRRLVKKSSEDELSWYRGHAWGEIERMLDSGELKQTTCVAWY